MRSSFFVPFIASWKQQTLSVLSVLTFLLCTSRLFISLVSKQKMMGLYLTSPVDSKLV